MQRSWVLLFCPIIPILYPLMPSRNKKQTHCWSISFLWPLTGAGPGNAANGIQVLRLVSWNETQSLLLRSSRFFGENTDVQMKDHATMDTQYNRAWTEWSQNGPFVLAGHVQEQERLHTGIGSERLEEVWWQRRVVVKGLQGTENRMNRYWRLWVGELCLGKLCVVYYDYSVCVWRGACVHLMGKE